MEFAGQRGQLAARRRALLATVATGVLVAVRSAGAQLCEWEALRETTFGDIARVRALLPFGDEPERALYAGGVFSDSRGGPGKYIARWDGMSWTPLGSGMGSAVYALALFDDGGGQALYVGGAFGRAGEILDANGVARWDGQEWSALGTGLRNDTDPPRAHSAAALIAFDDGSGPSLYVGGRFTEAGGVPALNVARWDGHEWHAMGDGLFGYEVRALAVYDDGSGPALYAGGYVAGGVSRWNGETWEPIGGPWGVGNIEAMVVFDDGSGPALYAGGQYAGGIARWDGEQWYVVGEGSDYDVRSLHVFDDGTGPALYAGPFPHGDGAFGVARWNGQKWIGLGDGLYDPRGISVDAMATFDDGSGPALYVAGKFSEAGGPGGIAVENIARWRCEPDCPADCDRSGDLTFFDFLCFQNLFAAMDPQADCDGSGGLDFFDFLCFQNDFAAGCQ